MRTKYRMQWAALVAVLAAAALTGCGTPGAPQPPSLNLPEPVSDLSATRAGGQVALAWTMPKRNTDKLLLKGEIEVRVCHKEGAGDCQPAGGSEDDRLLWQMLAPGADGTLTETLPATLAAGPPRPLSYFVELRNHNGRSAGLSNPAVVLAGAAPPPIANLTAELRKQGVVLRWTPAAESTTEVRLHRKLLNPPPAAKPQQGLLAPQPEPLEENLLVEAGAHQALDRSIRFGQAYEYRAQRVLRVVVDGKTLELAGELSAPVRVEAQDIFPPDVPTSLAAVATIGDTATQNAIDLSWQPVSDVNLVGYIVYRREGDAAWQRISPAEPLMAPAFHDAQVLPGHTYHYAVSALGQNGHDSARSAETEETVPTP